MPSRRRRLPGRAQRQLALARRRDVRPRVRLLVHGLRARGRLGREHGALARRGVRVRRRRLVPDAQLRAAEPVISGHKPIALLCDNGGFAVIERLQVGQGGGAVQQHVRLWGPMRPRSTGSRTPVARLRGRARRVDRRPAGRARARPGGGPHRRDRDPHAPTPGRKAARLAGRRARGGDRPEVGEARAGRTRAAAASGSAGDRPRPRRRGAYGCGAPARSAAHPAGAVARDLRPGADGGAFGGLAGCPSTPISSRRSRDDVHCVLIAAPTPLHASLVSAALAAGEHVLCEQPLTFDPEADLRLGPRRIAGLGCRRLLAPPRLAVSRGPPG